MTNIAMIRSYGDLIKAETLPPTIKLAHSDATVTIYDVYPKSHYHFLVIPFIRPPFRPNDLRDIRSLLQCPREDAKALLLNMRRDGLVAKALVEEEMVSQYGFKWDIIIGFHAIPSIEYVPITFKHLKHLHLHVLSTDFCGKNVKTKKHLNSFHPTLGFFLHIDEVLSWFEPDIEPTWFAMKSDITKKDYEPLLKEDLTCPGHCEKGFRSSVKLLDHLRMVFSNKQKDQQAKVDAAAAAAAANPVDEPRPAGAGTKRTADERDGQNDAGGGDTATSSESQPAKRHHPDASADAPQTN